MVVDCHTHVNFIAGEVEMAEHFEASQAVDVCLVHALRNGPSGEVNKQLSDYVRGHAERMVGFAVIVGISITAPNKLLTTLPILGFLTGFLISKNTNILL